MLVNNDKTGEGGRHDHEQTKSSGKQHRHRRHRKHQQQSPVISPTSDVAPAAAALDADNRNAARHRDVDVTAVASPSSQQIVDNNKR